MDGMHAGNLLGAGGGRSRGIMLNMAIAEEANLNLGGAGAEHEVAGVLINLIPKEGGNDFSGSFLGNYTNDSLQSDNLTQSVIDRGLNKVNKIDRIWDMNGTLGGPIFRNKLWFFASWRYWGKDKQIGDNYWNATQGTPVYTPDTEPPGGQGRHQPRHQRAPDVAGVGEGTSSTSTTRTRASTSRRSWTSS